MAELAKGGLNPAPTDVQLALFARHKRNGTTPGDPKWYTREKNVIRPFVFKPNQPPKYPHLPSSADWFRTHSKFTARRPEDIETRYVGDA